MSTLIFAHRGANHEAAENTRTAFELALNYPIDGMETDIQLSRDAVPVLWHDRSLLKLRLPVKHIDDFDVRELEGMNFAAHFSSTAKPEGVMRLSNFLSEFRKRTRLLLEIKNREWEERKRHEIKVRQTLEMVGPVGDDRIMVSSFNLDSLIYANRVRPKFPLVLNLDDDQGLIDVRNAIVEHEFLQGVCVHIGTLEEAMVSYVHNAQKIIAVYTCNTEDEIHKALALGVDILISDVPQYALQLRDKSR